MKRCPKCSRTFPDENQKFCTIDGGLLRAEQPPTVPFDPNLTVRATSHELIPPPNTIDAAEAPTSMRLDLLNETITSFGSSTFRETSPTGSPTAGDLAPPPESAPTSADLAAFAPAVERAAPVTVASSANLAPPETAAEPPVPVAAEKKKKSVLPWVLAILFVLLLIGGGAATAGYFFFLKPMLDAKRGPVVVTNNDNANSNTNTAPSPENSNTSANANTAVETKNVPPPYSPPADAVQFNNSPANLDGDLAAHYVGFSFYYPKTWTKDPKAGIQGASSFAKIDNQSPEEGLKERVLFNWYPSKGSYEADTSVFPVSAKKVTDQLSGALPNFEEVSRGETTVNSYKGYEVRFKGVFKDTAKGDLPYWGRVIFLPPGSSAEKGGVAVVMLATSLATEISSAADVGVKGDTALILDSFRFASR
jgi:hypothetical protein